jgi:hypothetical protein
MVGEYDSWIGIPYLPRFAEEKPNWSKIPAR